MSLRSTHLDQMRNGTFDTLIIGGGINGAVTAASLAGRGAHVALIDRGDFANFTSQASSNLVWGGFKYLENYELWLVFKLCLSRNRLMKAYRDNIKEIGFYAALDENGPYKPWFAAFGALGYWIIGLFGTRRPRLLSMDDIETEEPAINTNRVAGGIEYRDGILVDNDARFVFNFVRSAIEAGATASNYVELVSADRRGDKWLATLRCVDSGEVFTTTASTIVNAAGPFVDETNAQWGLTTEHRIVYSKGIHLVVPRLTTNNHHKVLAFYDDTERLFYVIPMGRRSVIGTTDTRVHNPETEVSDEDRDFVLSNINARLNLAKPLQPEDVIAERCGVRPLAALKASGNSLDVKQMSRKHVIEVASNRKHISIFGGKLTDCINVGDEICERVAQLGIELQPAGKWYGEPDAHTRTEFFRQAHAMGLDEIVASDTHETLSERLWRRYAANANPMLDAIKKDSSLAEPLLEQAGIRRCEIAYLAQHEMIVKLEDYLRRRSKIELLMPREILQKSTGLKEACEQLFGDNAQQRIDEYFD